MLPENETSEGKGLPIPSLIITMSDTPLHTSENILNDLLVAEKGDFLVSLKIKPTNNIKLFIDSDGEDGMSIDKCVRYNRALYKKIEEAALFPDGNFSLEVSSPGIGEPLLLTRQYRKNKGRLIEVTFTDDTIKEGKLLEVTEEDIIIEQTSGKGKKVETNQFVIPFTNIKATTVQIQF